MDSGFPRRADHPHAGGENNPHPRHAHRRAGPSPRGWGEQQAFGGIGRELRTIPTRVGRTRILNSRLIIRPDHPHAGGENSQDVGPCHGCAGPSPRGWGERLVGEASANPVRTIPTRVGRTRVRDRRPGRCSDHPHAGGENDHVQRRDVPESGPSPRGWGEPSSRSGPTTKPRTIPTRVGRTPPQQAARKPFADHPHAGGENTNHHVPRIGNYGPSPRGWGEQGKGRGPRQGRRTIPTRVGRTSTR